MSNRRRSKREIKIPLKFGDTVCDLIRSKNKYDNCELREEIGENDGEGYGDNNGDIRANGPEEIDVMEMMNHFPTIAESSRNVKINRSDEPDDQISNNNNNKLDENKLDKEGAKMKSYEAVKKSINGLVKLGEDDKLHGIIVNNFVAKLGEIGMKAEVECVYRNMFDASLVSQAKVSTFQIYAKAVAAKNGGEAKVKYGWFGGCSKEEIDRIVGYGFGFGDVGNCGGFGNAVVLNADHSPLDSVESAIADDYGVKHILFYRALLGKTEVVDRFSTQCHPSSEEFDSGVDDLVSPKKYIIWSSQMNTHILPEFVISFKTQRIVNRPQVNGVRLEKPVSPWIKISDLIGKLSKMLPPKSVKEITQYCHSYFQHKITRVDMIRGIKGIVGDRMLMMVLKEFTDKRRVNHPGGSINNRVN